MKGPDRYNAYGRWLRNRFGSRVHKVSIDGGFTCPNRDGAVAWGGCTYCNNESFRAPGAEPGKPDAEQIRDGIRFLAGRYRAGKFLVYWQNYTNTYAPAAALRERYARALNVDPRIVGMTVGTRPDCLEEEKLETILEVTGDRYACIEIGVESIYDQTLRRVNRGHDFRCTEEAVHRVRARGLDVCAHVVLGFPGESRAQLLAYPAVLNRLDIQFVKIHHLHIVRGTALAREYEQRPFPVFSLEQWADLLSEFIVRLDPRIVLQRLFGWTPEHHLIAPCWNADRATILRKIETTLEERDIWQGSGGI
ncbi:MAG: TIGR01212 family radical SAM protein [Acidobacteriota bacterium]